jgi:hypothetical protein
MRGERALNLVVLRISAASLAGVLTLLATSLYPSERYAGIERRPFIAGDRIAAAGAAVLGDPKGRMSIPSPFLDPACASNEAPST